MKDYQNKIASVQDILALVKSNGKIGVGDASVEPQGFMSQLHTIADRVKNVEIWTCLQMRSYPFMEDAKYADSFKIKCLFISKPTREASKLIDVSFAPTHLRHTCRTMCAQGVPDIFISSCSLPNADGMMSVSMSNIYTTSVLREAKAAGKTVVMEINKNMPFAYGDNLISVDDVDYLVPVEFDLPQDPPVPVTEKDSIIGGYIAQYINDGDCLQIGIGGIPNSVTGFLAGKKDLGIHTELLGDGIVDLAQRGIVNGSKKQFLKGKIVTSIVLGTNKTYDFVNNNPDVYVMSCEKCNDPYTIGQNDNQVSINTTLEVDLTGQACSESIGSRQFSGTGGQTDTTMGAQMSKGGKSFLALYSTANVKDPATGERHEISKIVPQLKAGATVSLCRNDMMYLVTEYGVVNLRGLTVEERAHAIISIAHPKYREWLTAEAKKLGLIR